SSADGATDQRARRAPDRSADRRAAERTSAGAHGLRAALLVLRSGLVGIQVSISIVIGHVVPFLPIFWAHDAARRHAAPRRWRVGRRAHRIAKAPRPCE